MKEKTCCFTGHRIILPSDYSKIKKSLYITIQSLIEQGVIYFGSGGALGFDTLAAEIVLALKIQYPQIKLIMVYPCKSQTVFWKEKDIEIYNQIQKSCDKCVYIAEAYDSSCMYKRNRHLVECSKYCVCYLKKYSGGTAYTVRYAYKKGLKIINIAEKLK